MNGDGLSFPVSQDAGGESAYEWAGAVAPDQMLPASGSGTFPLSHPSEPHSIGGLLQSRLRGHLREDSMV